MHCSAKWSFDILDHARVSLRLLSVKSVSSRGKWLLLTDSLTQLLSRGIVTTTVHCAVS